MFAIQAAQVSANWIDILVQKAAQSWIVLVSYIAAVPSHLVQMHEIL